MVSATGVLRTEGFDYCLENGAWTVHQKGTPFDEAKFDKALVMLGGVLTSRRYPTSWEADSSRWRSRFAGYNACSTTRASPSSQCRTG